MGSKSSDWFAATPAKVAIEAQANRDATQNCTLRTPSNSNTKTNSSLELQLLRAANMRRRKRRKKRKLTEPLDGTFAKKKMQQTNVFSNTKSQAKCRRSSRNRLVSSMSPPRLGSIWLLVSLGAILFARSHSQMAADSQPNGTAGYSLAMRSNVSALMGPGPAQTMTNASQFATSSQQMAFEMANRTVQSSGPSGAKPSSTSATGTKGQQARQHPAVHSSPAHNSRQRSSNSTQQQQQQPQVTSTQRQQRVNSAAHDNQMAADDAHETQAFMPNAAPTMQAANLPTSPADTQQQSEGPADANKAARGQNASETEAKRQQQPATGETSAREREREQEHQQASSASEQSGRSPASNVNSVQTSMSNGNSRQTSKQPATKTTSGQSQGGWQTVSTIISAPAAASWPRQRAGSSASSPAQAAPKMYLSPPPPPVNYNNYYNLQQQQLADFEQPGTQLERPSSGYSYGGPAYTHTVPLSPARQELLSQQAGELQSHRGQSPSSATKQRQRQFVLPNEQLARSSSTSSAFEQQHQQQQVMSANKPPASQLPQFNSNVQYAPKADPSLPLPPPPPPSFPQIGMMPPPHLTVTGTHASPCKPLSLAQLAQRDQQQQLLGNELASAASSLSTLLSLRAHQQQQQQQQQQAKYVRLGAGLRLRSQFVFKVSRADSLTDCELACSRASLLAGGNPLDTCRSFNYRAYFAAENCELSRSDAQQLKLDDLSQFEQHNHFDFYALDPRTQSPSQRQLMQLQQQQQQQPIVQQLQTYTPVGQEPADCLDVSQACSQDGMEFTLRTMEPFTGRIYTYGFYESCYFDGNGSTASTLKISRSSGFPRCGTQQVGDLMTNIVVVQFNDFVQTTRDKKYNLTCYFSGPGEAVVTSNYFDTKVDERSQPMQIEHLPPQNVITSNVHLKILHHGTPTNTMAVGDLLTFRLELLPAGGGGGGDSSSTAQKQSRLGSAQQDSHSAANQHHEIFATNVLAKDPWSSRSVLLIDERGCPVDPVNVFPELQRTPDGALESEFYAFKMPNSNFLIFQATVRTCKSPCEPVICHRAAPSATGLGQSTQQFAPLAQSSGGVKGAYLMAAAPQNAVPSWGRRRRRRKRQSGGEGAQMEALDEQQPQQELLGTGESVEHVIPVRFGQQSSELQTDSRRPNVLTRIKQRPDLSEAEEEVKEMFRVYLSRAEMAASSRQRQRAQQLRELEFRPQNQEGPETGANGTALRQHSEELEVSSSAIAAGLADHTQVCLNQFGYYAMLFSIIALSLIVLSVLLVAFYITRRAKFHMSGTLAEAIF